MQETPAPPPEAILIRQARLARGMTPAEVAVAAGISPGRITQIEAGQESRSGPRARAKPGTLARIAQAVGVTAEELRALPAEGRDKARLMEAAAILDRRTRTDASLDGDSPDGESLDEKLTLAELREQAAELLKTIDAKLAELEDPPRANGGERRSA